MTDATRRSVVALLPDRHAALALTLVLAVMAIGWRIPLPGLDLDAALGHFHNVQGDVAARLSVAGLGMIPLFTAAACIEIARLLIPPLDKRWASSVSNARQRVVVVAILALILAAWNGYDLISAIAESDYLTSDVETFVVAGMPSFLAVTAITIWLSGIIWIPKLGSGFWLLMAVSPIADFPPQFGNLFDMAAFGAMPGNRILVVSLCLMAGIVLSVFANLMIRHNGRASASEQTSILLWPPLLAGWAAGLALLVIPNDLPDWRYLAPSSYELAYLAISVVLIPILIIAYAFSQRRLRSDAEGVWSWPVLTMLTLVQIVLCAGAILFVPLSGVLIGLTGTDLLVVTAVMMAMRGSEKVS